MTSIKKTRSFFLILLLCTALLPGLTAENSPNVIVIMTDDQGWGDLSFTGNDDLDTPNIDSLGENGLFLDHFYVQPVCSPTRAEFLTGRYHPRMGVYGTSAGGERMDAGETSIAEVFRDAGYATGAFGKWHNGMQGPYHPNARGFEEFYGFCSGHWGDYFDAPRLEHNGELVQGEGFIIDAFTNRAIQFMRKVPDDKPFFTYLAYNTPHSPMQVPDRWWERFEDAPLGERDREPAIDQPQHARAALAMVENIDWNVGRILQFLETSGLEENTIVVFFSDNGPNGWRWNAGMKGRKGSTDEGGVRSPFFIRWPEKIPAGQKSSGLAGAIDLLPTLAALADIPAQTRKPLDGVNLSDGLMNPKQANFPDRLLFNTWRDRVSVRGPRFRLDPGGQLFDLENDPGQRENVAGQFPRRLNELVFAREAWKADVMAAAYASTAEDPRPLPVGHPEQPLTQLPARDGVAHGDIERSNRYPNNSFFRGWSSESDLISWDVEVITPGAYEAELHLTASRDAVGSYYELSAARSRLPFSIQAPHDPPLTGMENDRFPRIESYIKDFKPVRLGEIQLEAGRRLLQLPATNLPSKAAMDVRLLMLRPVHSE